MLGSAKPGCATMISPAGLGGASSFAAADAAAGWNGSAPPAPGAFAPFFVTPGACWRQPPRSVRMRTMARARMTEAQALGDLVALEDRRRHAEVLQARVGAAPDEHLVDAAGVGALDGVNVVRRHGARDQRLEPVAVDADGPLVLGARVGAERGVLFD